MLQEYQAILGKTVFDTSENAAVRCPSEEFVHRQMAKILEDGKAVFDMETNLQLETRRADEIPPSGDSDKSDKSDQSEHFEYFRPLTVMFPKTAEKTGGIETAQQMKGSYHLSLTKLKNLNLNT